MKEQEGLPLLELGTAYQSLRESGFDFSTAIGELIDNSVQANAKRIDIIPKIVEKKLEGKRKPVSVITQVAVIDDGDGMDEETLNGCPQLGFSTRYDDREGLGRFGVGATYASISQCKRTIFCSRPKGTNKFLATYIDLDEIASKIQTDIPKPSKSHLPEDMERISVDNSSTIVVWNKCDRLKSDANGNPIKSEDLLKELKKWVSRAYRYIIWNGVEIYVDGEKVITHDPLYLNAGQTEFPNDPCAIEWFSDSIDWSIPNSSEKTSSISIKLTLLPDAWRTKPGVGRSKHASERRIPDNEGVSVLRHHREVTFGNLWPTVPGQQDIDRWWGCEINFEPELDECWKVRNIKSGARPIKELSDALKEILRPEILEMRKEVQSHWSTGIPIDTAKLIRKTASLLMEEDNSVTVPEVESKLQKTGISPDNIQQILKRLASEKGWDWTTDGIYRKYAPSPKPPPKLKSEREACFETISCTIENSDIDQEFKDVALYDLEQARISYESGAFKACIVMLGAVIEGLMLGVIRKDATLNVMIASPKDAPKVAQNIKKFRLTSFTNPKELAEKISDDLGFEAYKNITLHFKPEIEKLKIEGIQNFRNSIHPWESIKKPTVFRDPSQIRALNYLTSLSLLAERILS